MADPTVALGDLPSTVTYTTWPSVDQATRGTEHTCPWARLVADYERAGARVRPKERLAAVVFCAVRSECSPDDCPKARNKGTTLRRHRCDDAVTAVYAVVLDHDDGHCWDPVEQWCARTGLAAILYESPSCTDEHPKWRLVVPLVSPYTDTARWADRYTAFRRLLTQSTGVEFDSKCCNASRVFFAPTRVDEQARSKKVVWLPGRALDLDATVASIPAPSPSPPISTSRPRIDASSVSDLDSQERDAFERWCQGALRRALEAVAGAGKGTRNNTLNEQAFSLFSRFVSPGLLDPSSTSDALAYAAKSSGLTAAEAKATINSALAAGRARPVMIHDLLSDWRRNRIIVPIRRRSSSPTAHQEETEPEAAIDPTTGDVTWLVEAPPKEQEEEEEDGDDKEHCELARVSELVPACPEKLRCPPGFQYVKPNGGSEIAIVRITRKRSQIRQCDCGVDNSAKANKCSGCGEPLDPTEPAYEEEKVSIAHVPMWIASELTSTSDDGNLIEVAAVVDRRKVGRILPRGLIQDPRRLVVAIESGGLALCTGKSIPYDVSTFLSSFLHVNRKVLPRKRACSRMGWAADMTAFLYGSESVGRDDLVLHTGIQGTDQLAAHFRTGGAAGEWVAAASAFILASPAAALGLAAAAASCLLRALSWQAVGVVMGGLGGCGKTACVTLAGSAYGATGDPSSRQATGVVGNGIATLHALVGQFLPLSDLPHIADEVRINAADARARADTEAALHALIDGAGKVRLRRDSRGTIASECSPGCAILATETDPSEFLRKGGALRRYLCPRPPYGDQLGRFRPLLAANYGHAGRALIHAIVRTTERQRRELSALREPHLARLREQASDTGHENESTSTWAEQVAVCLATVEVTAALCPTAWPDARHWADQIRVAWDRILGDPGERTEHGDPVQAAYSRTVEWVASQRAHLLPSRSHTKYLSEPELERRRQAIREPVIGAVREAEAEDTADEQLRIVDVYQDRLTEFLRTAGYSLRTLSREWRDRGWILCGNKARGNEHSIVARLGGVPVSVYRIVLPEDQPVNETEG